MSSVPSSETPTLDPRSVTPAELAAILARLGGRCVVTVAQILADVAAGCPTNDDGTLHVVHYAAWLVREAARE